MERRAGSVIEVEATWRRDGEAIELELLANAPGEEPIRTLRVFAPRRRLERSSDLGAEALGQVLVETSQGSLATIERPRLVEPAREAPLHTLADRDVLEMDRPRCLDQPLRARFVGGEVGGSDHVDS